MEYKFKLMAIDNDNASLASMLNDKINRTIIGRKFRSLIKKGYQLTEEDILTAIANDYSLTEEIMSKQNIKINQKIINHIEWYNYKPKFTLPNIAPSREYFQRVCRNGDAKEIERMIVLYNFKLEDEEIDMLLELSSTQLHSRLLSLIFNNSDTVNPPNLKKIIFTNFSNQKKSVEIEKLMDRFLIEHYQMKNKLSQLEEQVNNMNEIIKKDDKLTIKEITIENI